MRFKLLLFIFLFAVSTALGKKGFGPGEQEWGYVNIRPKAHMFWWLHYTTAKVDHYHEKPLLIFLQGGPGNSASAIGNFEEVGAIDATLKPRNHTWVKNYNVLFLDSPVGTGFSYVEGDTKEVYEEYIPKTNAQVAKDLQLCMTEFFYKFPNFRNASTYIVGESWGGKVTVEFAYEWYKEQEAGNITSNLKGIVLADPYISGADSYKAIGTYLYNFGMIDDEGLEVINQTGHDIAEAIEIEDWQTVSHRAIDMEIQIQSFTQHVYRFNVLKKVSPSTDIMAIFKDMSDKIYSKEVKEVMPLVKESLGLNSTWKDQELSVTMLLFTDSRKSILNTVEKLLNETDIKILLLNGQLDLIVPTPGTIKWIQNMHWNNTQNWMNAPRETLAVNNLTEAYCKAYEQFKFCTVLRAGHQVLVDNPLAVAPILKDFVNSDV